MLYFSFCLFFSFGIVLQPVWPINLCLITSGSFCKTLLKLNYWWIIFCPGKIVTSWLLCLSALHKKTKTYSMYSKTRNRTLVLPEKTGFFLSIAGNAFQGYTHRKIWNIVATFTGAKTKDCPQAHHARCLIHDQVSQFCLTVRKVQPLGP